jgi:SAM-dependent methyltransferase
MAEELEVYFQPPLHEQRKLWIFDIIRRELIHDILDIGCGEGALLYPLCHPAPYLPSTSDDFIYLRPNRVRALDVSEPDLQFAVKAASVPAEKRGSFYMPTLPRWQQLSTQIWHGGLEHLNEDFVGTECIVASEV